MAKWTKSTSSKKSSTHKKKTVKKKTVKKTSNITKTTPMKEVTKKESKKTEAQKLPVIPALILAVAVIAVFVLLTSSQQPLTTDQPPGFMEEPLKLLDVQFSSQPAGIGFMYLIVKTNKLTDSLNVFMAGAKIDPLFANGTEYYYRYTIRPRHDKGYFPVLIDGGNDLSYKTEFFVDHNSTAMLVQSTVVYGEQENPLFAFFDHFLLNRDEMNILIEYDQESSERNSELTNNALVPLAGYLAKYVKTVNIYAVGLTNYVRVSCTDSNAESASLDVCRDVLENSVVIYIPLPEYDAEQIYVKDSMVMFQMQGDNIEEAMGKFINLIPIAISTTSLPDNIKLGENNEILILPGEIKKRPDFQTIMSPDTPLASS